MNDPASRSASPQGAMPLSLLRVMALAIGICASGCAQPPTPARAQSTNLAGIDETVRLAMAAGAKGMAISVVDGGEVVFTKAYGVRDASAAPLREDSVMYGASLTKAVFGHLVMQLVEDGRLGLDVPIANYLPQPLPSYVSSDIVRRYTAFAGLAGDERWRKLTARILLTHGGGFANFHFLEPDKQLRIHFEPGSRYAYSGDGLILLQFVLEQGLGIDVGAEMNRRLFAPNGLTRTSMIWRADFRPNVADGFGSDGRSQPHDERSKVRVSGSLDTSIADMGRLAASHVRGDGLSAAARAELVKAHLPISTRSQFPTLQEPRSPSPFSSIGAGLGVVAFNGPQGAGYFKGGHNDVTANTWVCVEAGKRCVVILANDVRAESAFPALVASILGESGVPWAWEYGEMKFWSGGR